MQVTKHVDKGIHLGFENQERCHQKSKTGVSVARKNVFPKFKKDRSDGGLFVNRSTK